VRLGKRFVADGRVQTLLGTSPGRIRSPFAVDNALGRDQADEVIKSRCEDSLPIRARLGDLTNAERAREVVLLGEVENRARVRELVLQRAQEPTLCVAIHNWQFRGMSRSMAMSNFR
jgi:hypothetical protein